MTPEILEFISTLSSDEQEILTEFFEEEVHDKKSQEAADINNDGLHAQLAYLALSNNDIEAMKVALWESKDDEE